jgi:catechol 2,3-dioxygenase-like lactoylglutathione lyase family enzyme
MIRGVHTMFYSSDVDGLRAFIRDKLGFLHCDVGQGWLIFDLPEADLGCHPEDLQYGGHSGKAHISFYCDDIEKTVAELKAKGVEFTKPINDEGFGRVTEFRVPGGFDVMLYEPRYVKKFAKPSANGLKKRPATKKKPAAKAKSKSKSRR